MHSSEPEIQAHKSSTMWKSLFLLPFSWSGGRGNLPFKLYCLPHGQVYQTLSYTVQQHPLHGVVQRQHLVPSVFCNDHVNQALAGREFSSLAFIFVFPGWIKGIWKDKVAPRGEKEVPDSHRTQWLNCFTDTFSLSDWKAKLYAKPEPPHISHVNGRIFRKTRQ